MKITVNEIEGFVQMVETRMPFRYGAARLVRCPHYYLTATVADSRGRSAQGIAADNLPPKWFDKDPSKTFPHEVADQLNIINWAAAAALAASPSSPFHLWLEIYTATQTRAAAAGLPALLGGFGPSLVERAINDAVGKLLDLPFHALLRSEHLGIDLALIDPDLKGISPSDVLPQHPLQSIAVRHAIGLADSIRAADIPLGDHIHDGLPQSLDEVVDFYHVRHFKIKVQNRLAEDLDRLTAIADVLDARLPNTSYHTTLDGNEQYETVDQLLPLVDALSQRPALARLAASIIFLEQPLARSVALDAARCRGIEKISAQFPVIIDESDSTFESFPKALQLGYRGTSHKNCKNTFKSLANLARVERRKQLSGVSAILSAEDLTNIGVVALPQDLAALSTLGITHAERNGHHYFRGLSHLRAADQESALLADPHLYCRDKEGVRVAIRDGQMSAETIHHVPGLGTPVWPTLSDFTPAAEFDPGILA